MHSLKDFLLLEICFPMCHLTECLLFEYCFAMCHLKFACFTWLEKYIEVKDFLQSHLIPLSSGNVQDWMQKQLAGSVTSQEQMTLG